MREGCGGFCSEEDDEQESGKKSRVLDAGGCPPILSQSLHPPSYLDHYHINVTETPREILSCCLDWFGSFSQLEKKSPGGGQRTHLELMLC